MSAEVEPLYFDHNACTPVDPRVLQRFVEVEQALPANPGSLHAAGRRARALLEDSRCRIAALFGTASEEVTFVSGGTEANNTAVRGLGDPGLPVLLAPIEHPSVLEPARERGLVSWSVDGAGRAIVEAPDRPVGLCCLTHGQNELGTLQPIDAAGRVARSSGIPLHVDVSQTLGRVAIEPVCEVADSIAVSAHKIGGLRGASVLICRRSLQLRPLFAGGGQEGGRRGGTPSVALAAACALAIELAVREQVTRAERMRAARDRFLQLVVSGLRSVRCLTPAAQALPNTAMLLFADVDGRTLLPALDLAGVQASQGSACSSGSPEPPRVLAAIGLSDDDARRCVRFSFSAATPNVEVENGAQRVVETVTRLRRVARP